MRETDARSCAAENVGCGALRVQLSLPLLQLLDDHASSLHLTVERRPHHRAHLNGNVERPPQVRGEVMAGWSARLLEEFPCCNFSRSVRALTSQFTIS